MKWNLRLAAANRGIWKASELQKMLAARGMVISAGKMSGLWSGNPNTIRLYELDVICAVLGCEVGIIHAAFLHRDDFTGHIETAASISDGTPMALLNYLLLPFRRGRRAARVTCRSPCRYMASPLSRRRWLSCRVGEQPRAVDGQAARGAYRPAAPQRSSHGPQRRGRPIRWPPRH